MNRPKRTVPDSIHRYKTPFSAGIDGVRGGGGGWVVENEKHRNGFFTVDPSIYPGYAHAEKARLPRLRLAMT